MEPRLQFPADIPRQYVFNHFPKTGGNSLLRIFRRHLAEDEISPHLTDHSIRSIPPSRFEHYRLIAGHFSVVTQARFARSRYSITMLRDPIRTVVSGYHFWRQAPVYTEITSKAKELSFPDFVRYFAESPAIMANPFTWHFAAVDRNYPEIPTDAAALLAAARHNLAAFSFVGVLERFQESMELLCGDVGWPAPINLPHENRSGSEEFHDRIDPDTLATLLERNQLDLQLYEYANSLLDRRSERSHGDHRAAGDMTANSFVLFPVSPAPQRTAAIRNASAVWVTDAPAPALEVNVGFRTTEFIKPLVAGILINDAEGAVVFGTNTLELNARVAHAPNHDCVATFLLDIHLPAGLYFITVALQHSRRVGCHYDWIDRATLFEVAGEHCTAGHACIELREFHSRIGGWAPDLADDMAQVVAR